MALLRLLKNKIWLLLVLTFALFLYLYRLDSIPPAVYVDEAVAAYDAYSISQTLRDHYGQLLPLNFKFFGSYTPGLYVYLQAIIIRLLGLNEFSLRLLSSVSMLAVALAIYYFFTKENLLKSKSSKLIGVFIFLISPWTVFNARLGYETTFAFALISFGILLYRKPYLSLPLLSLSTYAAHTQRYLAPLVIGLIFILFHTKRRSQKTILWPIVIALLIQVPNLWMLTKPAFWVKSDSLTASFISQYLSYFSPNNLFNNQDYDLQRSIPKLAVFYSWMFIPWITGLYTLYTNRKNKIYRYLFGLILLTPLPAALANTNYSTQRALPLLLPYTLIITIGMDRILYKIKKPIKYPALIGLSLFSLLLLFRSYYLLFPMQRAKAWNYGYKQLSSYISENPQKEFIIDNSRGVPYILLLYYLKYPPTSFQQENPKNSDQYYTDTAFNSNANFANVKVKPIDWKYDISPDQVIVGDNLSISPDQISDHSLQEVFLIKDNHNEILLQGYQASPRN